MHQLLPSMLGDVLALGIAITANLAIDRIGVAVEHSGNGALAHVAQQTGLFFDAEFVIRHGNTYRKGQVLHLVFAVSIHKIRNLCRQSINQRALYPHPKQ